MVSVLIPRRLGRHGSLKHRRSAVIVLTALTLLACLQFQRLEEGEWVVLDPTLAQSTSQQQLVPDFWSSLSSSSSKKNTQIRRWGCNRQEAPFLFVHIGKAGGGGIRIRMAASALDYDRENWKRTNDDNSYYPIVDANRTMHKGRFYTSAVSNYIPDSMVEFHGDFSFEGHFPCTATTPLGQAIACPVMSGVCDDFDKDGASGNRCDAVYMGHNMLGSELHWLPTSFLVEWWRSTPWAKAGNDFMEGLIQNRFAPSSGIWKVPRQIQMLASVEIPTVECPEDPGLTWKYSEESFLKKCLKPREAFVDGLTRDYIISSVSTEPSVIQYAQMIASLPVLRVTVLRDPFSWLMSKFFWHENHYSRNKTKIGPDLGSDRNDWRRERYQKLGKEYPRVVKCDDVDEATAPDGWASIRAWTYLFYLCGEHCAAGYANGSMSLEEMELQAAYNLRNSFAVVGLLEDTVVFYEMVSKRVGYMDTSLHPDVGGARYRSGGYAEADRCKEVYADPNFQRLLTTRSPVIAALARLHQIGIEVNQFQKEELAQCS